MTFRFVIPDPASFSSGGNLYNSALIDVLEKAGHQVHRLPEPDESVATSDCIFWDTLHLTVLLSSMDNLSGQRHVLLTHADSEALRMAIPRLAKAGISFLATGKFMIDLLASQGIPMERIFLLEPPGILRLPETRKWVRIPGECLSLVMASSLTRDKGLLEFFQLWTNLDHPSSDALRIDIYGDDRIDESWAARLKALWKQSPWKDLVSFRGLLSRDEFLTVLQDYDALLSVSPAESYGMAIAEALAAGLPVLARSGGNVNHLIQDRKNGLLFEQNRDLIAWLMHQPGKRHLPNITRIEHADQPTPVNTIVGQLECWVSSAF